MPELRSLPLDQVEEPEVTPRAVYEDAGIMELAESIRAVGLLQPIGVRQDGERFVRVFGKRRLLACRWLGLSRIDVVVLTTSDALEYEAATAENVQRRDMNPVEEARAVRHMIEGRGKTVRQVAAALGRSESWVRQRVEVLLWPVEVVEAVARGDVPVAVARELVAVEDERVRAHFLGCAIASGVTASQMRLWRQDWEAQRPLDGMDGGAPTLGVAASAPVLPMWPCAVCAESLPVTSLTMLRCCAACVLRLDEAKREASGG